MKRFDLQCTFRVLSMGATLAAAVLLFSALEAYVAAGLAVFFAAAQLYALVRYVRWTNRELSRFLSSVRYGDFSQRFTDQGRGGTFTELGEAFTDVMDEFRQARAEKEAQHRYLENVMQHVGVGLISLKAGGEVSLINTAARRLLGLDRLRHVSDLSTRSERLADVLRTIRSGQHTLVKLQDGDELLQLSIHATAFKLQGERYLLVSLQNIHRELEEKEVEAWQKLTRVLTHEIMNSVTPVASLASTAKELLADAALLPVAPGDRRSREPEVLQDVHDAVSTIERRSQSLLHFVEAYRRLMRVPRPELQHVRAADLFRNVCSLLDEQLSRRGLTLGASLDPPDLTLTADPDLIEQVLINLVKNAAEAQAGQADAWIKLRGFLDPRGRPVIQVIDQGPGIIEEAIDKIFVPFYTTKKEGSGIGLSLSREIMRQHGGTIRVRSHPDEPTTFTLRFRSLE